MALKDMLLPEVDHEMAQTRRVLERIPEDRLGWRPHPKSNDFAGLATHLAQIPHWGIVTIQQDSYDLMPGGKPTPRAEAVRSRAEAVTRFDGHVAAFRAALAGASDDQLRSPWSLLKNGQTVLTKPRVAMLRTAVLSHTIHHRAQMCVYLRLVDVPVPGMYGASADEM